MSVCTYVPTYNFFLIFKSCIKKCMKKSNNSFICQILGSPVEEDECGICGGDGSKCKQRFRAFKRRSSNKIGHAKVMILPAGSRNIEISFQSKANVSLALKERQTNLLVHQGHQGRSSVNRSTFVTEGTKFTYKRSFNGLNDLWHGKGPLLAPLVVLSAADRIGSVFSVNVSYTVSRFNDPLFSMQKYEWVIKGWSKCSKECGGGHQHLILK